jgi:HSP20 family protein
LPGAGARAWIPVNRSSSPTRRWDPWREFEELQSRVDQLFGGIFGRLDSVVPQIAWRPLADVTETDDANLVEVDVPGMKAEDIRIETTGTELVVWGETTEKERDATTTCRTLPVAAVRSRSLPRNGGRPRPVPF